MDIENLGKRSEVIDASIINRIQEMAERISGAEDTIGNRHNSQRKCKVQKGPNPKHPGNSGHNENLNLRIIDIEESKDPILKKQ